MSRAIAIMIVSVSITAGVSAQDVIILDSMRDLGAELVFSSDGGVCGDGEYDEAHALTEPGFWHQTIHVPIQNPQNPENLIVADGTQYSDVAEDGVLMFGFLDYDLDYVCGQYWWNEAQLHSSCRTRLIVLEPTLVYLSGEFGVEMSSWSPGVAPLQAAAHLVIDKLAGQTVYEELIPVDNFNSTEVLFEQPLSGMFELTPGVYDISVRMTVYAQQHWFSYDWSQSAQLSHIVQLDFLNQGLPPSCEFTDSDNDGDIDLRDFYMFQQCFSGPGF